MFCLPFAKAHLCTAGGHSRDAKVLVVPGASLGTRTGAAGLCRAGPQGMSKLAQLRCLGPLCRGLLCRAPRPCQPCRPRRRSFRQQWWSAAPSQQCVPPPRSSCRAPLQVSCSKRGLGMGPLGIAACCLRAVSSLQQYPGALLPATQCSHTSHLLRFRIHSTFVWWETSEITLTQSQDCLSWLSHHAGRRDARRAGCGEAAKG